MIEEEIESTEASMGTCRNNGGVGSHLTCHSREES